IFFAIGNPQESIRINLTNVSGVKPSSLQGLCAFLRHLVIPFHDVRATDKNLAVFGNLHFLVTDNAPNGADARGRWPIQRNNGRSLGQSVTLVDRHSDRPQEFCDPLIECRAAGYEESEAPAQPLTDCAKHHTIRNTVGKSLLAGPHIGAPNLQSFVENGAPDSWTARYLREDTAVHLLKEPWNACSERRPHGGHVFNDRTNTPGIGNGASRIERGVVDVTLEDVRQGQKRQVHV